MTEEQHIPKSIMSKTFNLMGTEITVHVLDNGTRIIEAASLERFFSEFGASIYKAGLIAVLGWGTGVTLANWKADGLDNDPGMQALQKFLLNERDIVPD